MQLETTEVTRQPYSRATGTRLDRAWAWPIQAVTGVLLIVIVFLHMYLNHFQEGGMLSSAGVILHIANPAIFILEILFVIVVTYHALLGVRAIIFDLSSSETIRRNTTISLTVLGVVTVIYGMVLAWLIRSQMLV